MIRELWAGLFGDKATSHEEAAHPLGPFDQYRAPFLVVKSVRRNGLVRSFEGFREAYPEAAKEDLERVRTAFDFGMVRLLRIIPGKP